MTISKKTLDEAIVLGGKYWLSRDKESYDSFFDKCKEIIIEVCGCDNTLNFCVSIFKVFNAIYKNISADNETIYNAIKLLGIDIEESEQSESKSNYERLTNKDIVVTLNKNDYEDATRFYLYAQRLWELENKMERREPLAHIGDSVYQRDNAGNIYKSTIKKIIYETDGIAFDESAIGQSVFLSEEDLKNKLLEDKSQ